MLFSDGACSRRVSLFLKPFSFPRRCAKLKRERKSWELGKSGRILSSLFCFVLCGMPREGGKRQKMKKKNEFEKSTLKHENLRVRYVMLSF